VDGKTFAEIERAMAVSVLEWVGVVGVALGDASDGAAVVMVGCCREMNG
jgi:hypothetical protein